MPAHWTYRACDASSDLEQGDILRPSPGLLRLFQEVHPHFTADKYLGFLVTTQSCDLVRRKGGQPKAQYLNLASIRPLSQVLRKIVSHVAEPVAPGWYLKSKKVDARQLFERLFNQNEQQVGLFFLFNDADVGIGEDAVAMLRVSVAVRSEHYQLLVDSRSGRLDPEFQAKLGWLIGNLYNRPATPDWSDRPTGKERFERLVRQYVESADSAGSDLGITWIDDVLIQEANASDLDLSTATLSQLETLRPKPTLDRALEEIQAELAKVAPDFPPDQIEKLKNRLKNSARFRKTIAT